jgi:type 1 glutamine amidotransferase
MGSEEEREGMLRASGIKRRAWVAGVLAGCLGGLLGGVCARGAEPVKVVLVAGNPSHGPGDHEFNAGCLLLARCLRDAVPGMEPIVVKGGWPQDESVFEGAKAIVFFMDGGGGHPMIQGDRLEKIQKLMDRGVGLVCLHYAVEVPKGKPGEKFQEWIGGYYETGYSTNPHWVAEIKALPDHPIARGVKPFAVKDEWYFNMRFREDMRGITPILVATPDDATRQGRSSSPRGPYPHIVAASGRAEVLCWAVERPDGGRGVGHTGAHVHRNWGDPNFRKLFLNAILWAARVEVPEGGVETTVTAEELKANLDPK